MKVLHVFSGPYNNPCVLAQIESLRQDGIETYILSLNTRRNALNYFTGFFRLRKRLKYPKYGLVHAHYAYCGLIALFQKKMPIVVSFMGSDLLGILNSDRRQTLMGMFNIIVSKIVAKNADAVIVKSNRMKEALKLSNVYVIPNGVDFTKFKPVIHNQGRLEQKELKQILFIAVDPKDKAKSLNLAVLAVEILKRSVANIQLSVVSNIAQEKVAELMNRADVLLVTSRWEGSPNVVKEAMACNLPIVSTDVGDVKEVIGKTEGCFITTFEPEDVAEKIRMALDFGRRTNGRENIKHLEINNIAKRVIAVYKQVLEKR